MGLDNLIRIWYNAGVIILLLVAAGAILIILIFLLSGDFHEIIDIPENKNIWVNRKKFKAPRDHFKIKEKWKE